MNLNKENLISYLEGRIKHLKLISEDLFFEHAEFKNALSIVEDIKDVIESGIFDVEETESEKYLKLYIENLAKELKGEKN